jgi:hypothetical protein
MLNMIAESPRLERAPMATLEPLPCIWAEYLKVSAHGADYIEDFIMINGRFQSLPQAF